ncbi:MAG: TIGR03435 family protein [Bryobacteraceae bacterium]
MSRTLTVSFAASMKILPIAIASLALSSAQPDFEVVSVKPTPKERLRNPEQVKYCENGRFFSAGFPVSFLIRSSYQIGADQILGLPEWAMAWESGYDIDAKSAAPVSQDQCRLVVRSLLADRFRMKAHRETREMRGYALVVGEHRPKLEEGTDATINGQTVTGSVGVKGLSMSSLAQMLTDHPAVRLPVIDRTGLKGSYGFSLTFSLREDDGAALRSLPL